MPSHGGSMKEACSLAGVAIPPPTGHHPTLVRRADDRWEVRCPQCERRSESPPLGIGVAVANKLEAESILRNHAGRAA
jgi:hypothetical protein